MQALHFTAPRVASLVDTPPPEPQPGDALVAPRFVGLCGTDLELFEGTMPYFAEGTASYPIQPGHEVSGVVAAASGASPAVGTEVLVDPVIGCGKCQACAASKKVRCADRREIGLRLGVAGGAGDLIAVPGANLHPLPGGVGLREAVLAEPGVTALNAVERLGEVTDRRALVVGAGTVGLIAAQLLAGRGAKVDVMVVEDTRAPLVARFARVVREVEPACYPAVIEAAGVAAAVRVALRAVAPGGRVALTGVQSEPVRELELNEVVLKDATITGVLNGPGLFDSILAELGAGNVDAAALIDVEFTLSEWDLALGALADPTRSAPKVMLRVGEH